MNLNEVYVVLMCDLYTNLNNFPSIQTHIIYLLSQHLSCFATAYLVHTAEPF